MVGAMKALEIAILPSDFPTVLRQMQQELFNPPGVEGWDGGKAWLSTTTFLTRTNLLNRLISGNDPNKLPFLKPLDWLTVNGLSTNQQIVDYFVRRLLEGDLPSEAKPALLEWLAPTTAKTQLRRIRGLIHLLMSGPTYELN